MPVHSPSRIILAHAGQRRALLTPARNDAFSVDAPAPARGTLSPGLGEVVIDLTGTSPARRDVPSSRRLRPWVLLLVVAAVVAVGLAAANYSAAMRWRTRAMTAERRAAQASADAAAERGVALEALRARDVARQRRRAMAQQLTVSEADVVALEARVSTLASDRARAQDLGLDLASVPASMHLQALRAQAASCIAQVEAARKGLTANADVGSWQAALTAAEASCGQIAADVDTLASTTR